MKTLIVLAGLLTATFAPLPQSDTKVIALEATVAEQAMLIENMAWLTTGATPVVTNPYCEGSSLPPPLPTCLEFLQECLDLALFDWNALMSTAYDIACTDWDECSATYTDALNLALDQHDARIVACRRAYITQMGICNSMPPGPDKDQCYEDNDIVWAACKAASSVLLAAAFEAAGEASTTCYTGVQTAFNIRKSAADTIYSATVIGCCLD